MNEKKVTQVLKRLRTPEKIQDFLDALPFNHEDTKETCSSPLTTLTRGTAHCLEGALIAAAALIEQGEKPLIMNLKTARGDQDHAITLFTRNGLWGAISKTNHTVLRYRDPIYRTPRELVLSYFHEYFLADTGRKTLIAYSPPINLRRFGVSWIHAPGNVWEIAYALADAPHTPIAPPKALSRLRRATPFERSALIKEEWPRQKRT